MLTQKQASGSVSDCVQPRHLGLAVMASLDRRWLLAVYLIVPATVLTIVLDHWVFGQILRVAILPVMPEQWSLWVILFGLPHVVAGTLTMADSDYLRHYRKQFILPLILYSTVALAGVLGPSLVRVLVPAWLGIYTIYHLLTQQIGLSFTMLRPSRLMLFWKWMILLTGFLLYVGVYVGANIPDATIGGYDPYALCVIFSGSSLLLLTGSSFFLLKTVTAPVGARYLWANVAMIGSVFFAFVYGYTIFIIIIPRVIHDLTAFLIYANHDRNRNACTPHNYLYRLTRSLPLPFFLILPAISITLAYLLQASHHWLFATIIYLLTFMHYHTEAIVWRRPNLHRQHLNFA